MARLPSIFALRALEAAVRRRSYSAAARELAVTQGAISQQIRKLEAEFGARLFARHGNEMVPSASALRLAESIKAGLDQLSGAVGDFAAAAAKDPLVISMSASFAGRWLGPRLDRLLTSPEGANLDLRVEDRVADFVNDGVDMGVRMGRGDWLGLERRRLTRERLCVVSTAAFAERHRIETLSDLAKAPLIDTTDHLWADLFGRHGLAAPAEFALVANSVMVVVDAVLRNMGAAIVRYSMVEHELRTGTLIRAVPDILPLPVNFVRGPQLVRVVFDGDPAPDEHGYFVVWRLDNRKQRRIHALAEWLAAEAELSEAALA